VGYAKGGFSRRMAWLASPTFDCWGFSVVAAVVVNVGMVVACYVIYAVIVFSDSECES